MKKIFGFTAAVMLLCVFCFGGAPADGYSWSPELWAGDTVRLGSYEQDNNVYNGAEDIYWTVLSVEGDTALLIADRALDCMPYHSWRGAVAWGDSDIRNWLNNVFFYTAFDWSGRNCIQAGWVSSSWDYVFLPDKAQAEYYKIDRGCVVSEYAKAQGVQIGKKNGLGCWWVRMDTTFSDGNGRYVAINGKVYDNNRLTIGNNGVRPMIRASVTALYNGGYVASHGNSGNSSGSNNNGNSGGNTSGVVGYTNQKLATRCGPSTGFDETHTYNLGVGTQVTVLRYQVTNGTPWVEVEFRYGSEYVRAWTGKKRIDSDAAINLPGDYSWQASGQLNQETPGWFGPGSGYRVLYTSVASGTGVDILASQNGWVLIEYYTSGNNLIHRCWVPSGRVDQW